MTLTHFKGHRRMKKNLLYFLVLNESCCVWFYSVVDFFVVPLGNVLWYVLKQIAFLLPNLLYCGT